MISSRTYKGLLQDDLLQRPRASQVGINLSLDSAGEGKPAIHFCDDPLLLRFWRERDIERLQFRSIYIRLP
jgi:hypothetical protein